MVGAMVDVRCVKVPEIAPDEVFCTVEVDTPFFVAEVVVLRAVVLVL